MSSVPLRAACFTWYGEGEASACLTCSPHCRRRPQRSRSYPPVVCGLTPFGVSCAMNANQPVGLRSALPQPRHRRRHRPCGFAGYRRGVRHKRRIPAYTRRFLRSTACTPCAGVTRCWAISLIRAQSQFGVKSNVHVFSPKKWIEDCFSYFP